MTSVLSHSKSNVFTVITAKIVSAIEEGAGTFVMPWHGGIIPPAFPVNAATGKSYRGVNIVALWAEAALKGCLSGYWASYKQWQSLGAQVRKGERGAAILFYKTIERETETNDNKEQAIRAGFVARTSYVFNAEQVDGWQPPIPASNASITINERVAAFIRATGTIIHHGVCGARYRHDLDRIDMPLAELFVGTGTSSPEESCHAVLCHETIHWSGARHRLNRDFGKRFGDHAYAFEELVAELGAAFLCSTFRLTNESRPDHAAYIASWLEILQQDKKAIFAAASKAQEAVEYLLNLAPSDATK